VTADLFATATQLEPVHMPDADVSYMPTLEIGADGAAVMRALIQETPWRAERIVVWGKSYPQPRLIAWFGDAEHSYTYSGIRLHPLPWTDLLRGIKAKVKAAVAAEFNSVLLNYYRDNRDSMGLHCDDEPELGDRPTIASLSLGDERTLVFKHKHRSELKPVRLMLASGSLLLMKGETQRFWKHGIGKESRLCGPRVNLTFRRIYR
jgi:alkylated DNA repair dioxygenase AlkB